MTTTLTDTLNFVSTADESDLDRIMTMVRARHKTLRIVSAAAAQVGMVTVLADLSPQYLNGLKGTVTSIRGQRGVVTLDATSTNLLRRRGGRRYSVPVGATTFDLPGVPLSACKATT